MERRITWIAFYTTVPHEVLQVTRGTRIISYSKKIDKRSDDHPGGSPFTITFDGSADDDEEYEEPEDISLNEFVDYD